MQINIKNTMASIMCGRRAVQRLISLSQFQFRSFGTHLPERDPRFASVTDADVATFRGIVGDAGVVTDPHELQAFNRDWMGKYEGAASVALRPRSTAQVSALLQYCHARRLAVVPQGGNTGLVGGSVPVFDEVVLSLAAMRAITGFDAAAGVVTCQAGAVLQALDAYVGERGHCVPLDLGAKGSCHVGGNVATNAGGLRLLRYGSLRGSVVGLEAVLADGTVLDLLTSLRKDNTGYDLKQLFIGSEGTLGVITGVALACPPRPAAVHVAYLAAPSFAAALRALAAARAMLGEVLSAFEFLDRASLQVALEHLPGASDPLPGSSAPFFLVVETSGACAAHDAAKLGAYLEAALAEGWAQDGVLAASGAQAAALWALREGVTTALRHRGAIYKYDLSLPTDQMYGLVEDTRARLERLFPGGALPGAPPGAPPLQVVGYGHLGDGNLHLNISAPEYSEALREALEPFVYEWTAARRGSVSAEHGLGLMKAAAIGYSKPRAAVALMRGVKKQFDPRGILNPYKLLPPLESGGA